MEGIVAGSLRVEFIERVRHIFSEYRTNDDELAYAKTIQESADVIKIESTIGEDANTEVIVSTQQAVYHFRTFRSDYAGHASRTLLELLAHFRVNLPLEYVIAHQSFDVYLNGNKIVASEKEYPIAERADGYELVEPVEFEISIATLNTIFHWAKYYQVEPVEVIESAVQLMNEKLKNASEENEVEATS